MYVKVLKDQIVTDVLEEFLRRCYLRKVCQSEVTVMSFELSLKSFFTLD